jgi:hypothetical protein
MTQLTHSEARSLLSRSLDAQLGSGERRALDEHLAQCDACSAYGADLQRMNAHLFESLQARWTDPNLSSLEMDRSLRLTGQRVRQRSTGRRLMLVAQPAVWTLGAVALVAAMAWIISSIGPTPAEDVEGTPTPTTESIAASATPELSVAVTATGAATATRGICTAEVITATDLREGPNEGYLSKQTVYPGISGQVLSVYYGDPDTTWLQVYVKETATLEYVGWLMASTVTYTGDCKTLDQVAPTATPDSESGAAQSQNSTAGNAKPGTSQESVCYARLDLSTPPDHSVFDAPDRQFNSIGQVEDGEWYRVTGLYAEDTEWDTIWYRIEFAGQVGWVMEWYYEVDGRGTDGCLTLEAVAVDLPDYTPTPTWSPTSTAAPEVDLNDILYVVPDSPYNSASMSWTLTQDNPIKYVGVRVNNIYGGDAVSLNVMLECNGGESLLDLWGVNGEASDLDCGTSYYNQEGMTQGNNFIAFKISLPADVSSLTFTIYATVEP